MGRVTNEELIEKLQELVIYTEGKQRQLIRRERELLTNFQDACELLTKAQQALPEEDQRKVLILRTHALNHTPF
jgi:hypothetical protein